MFGIIFFQWKIISLCYHRGISVPGGLKFAAPHHSENIVGLKDKETNSIILV